MQIVRDRITIDELKKMSETMYNSLVKAVVDVEKKIMAVDMEMHADGEMVMLEEEGSNQEDLWGINIHPELEGDGLIEFDSMINIRPSQGNRTRNVDNKDVREKIKQIIFKLVVQ